MIYFVHKAKSMIKKPKFSYNHRLIEQAVKYHIRRNLQATGRLINSTFHPPTKGHLLALLAGEIMLRKKNAKVAFRVLHMAQLQLCDEYHSLLYCQAMRTMISDIRRRPIIASDIIHQRNLVARKKFHLGR